VVGEQSDHLAKKGAIVVKRMKKALLLAMVFVFVASAAWGAPRKVTIESYLTAADIQNVSGLKGVKSIPKTPNIGAGGDLNFTTGDNNLIVMVQVVAKSQYAGYKQMFFKAAVQGLGEEEMHGATVKGGAANLVAFTKGVNCIALTVFANPKDFSKNMLTIEQTIKLAKIIVTRM